MTLRTISLSLWSSPSATSVLLFQQAYKHTVLEGKAAGHTSYPASKGLQDGLLCLPGRRLFD